MTTHRANQTTTFNCKAVAHVFDVTPALSDWINYRTRHLRTQ